MSTHTSLPNLLLFCHCCACWLLLQEILGKEAEVVVAGGSESMSQVWGEGCGWMGVVVTPGQPPGVPTWLLVHPRCSIFAPLRSCVFAEPR